MLPLRYNLTCLQDDLPSTVGAVVSVNAPVDGPVPTDEPPCYADCPPLGKLDTISAKHYKNKHVHADFTTHSLAHSFPCSNN